MVIWDVFKKKVLMLSFNLQSTLKEDPVMLISGIMLLDL